MKTTFLVCLVSGLMLLSASIPCWAQKHGTLPFTEIYSETETGTTARAQSASSFAPCPATQELAGYWMVETSFTLHKYSMVRFYDGHDNLVYEEGLAILFSDLSKRSQRRVASQIAIVLQCVLFRSATQASGNLLAQQLRSRGLMQRSYPVSQLATSE